MIDTKHLYIGLIKKCILGYIYKDASIARFPTFHEANYEPDAFDGKLRELGRDWPSQAHSMIGLKHMNNLVTHRDIHRTPKVQALCHFVKKELATA